MALPTTEINFGWKRGDTILVDRDKKAQTDWALLLNIP
jgi:hypothetical protein